jgi:chromate reductase
MQLDRKIKILGFAGSLRKGSYNRAILRAAKELAPDSAELEIFDLDGIPPFNADLEGAMPKTVKDFKSKIEAADALLMVTPEYNYSMSGVLKNAIDWASRPYTNNSFNDKPAAIMSASTGMLGGARAQYHLRQVFVFMNVHALNRPEVMVANANTKIDAEGRLTDEDTREHIKKLLDALVQWTIRLKAEGAKT